MLKIFSVISKNEYYNLADLINTTSVFKEPEESGYEVTTKNSIIYIAGDNTELEQQVFEDDRMLVILNGYVLDDKIDYKLNIAKQILDQYILKGAISLKEFSGAFYIILAEKQSGKLIISNDRLGIKPLYYYQDNDKFIFASDIKTIVFSNQIKKEINWSAWGDIFNYGFIIGDKTPFENILSLPMASILSFQNRNFELQKYWTLNDVKINYKQNEKEIVNKGIEILKSLTHKYERFIKDATIPLSGGYDSRCIACCLKFFSQIQFDAITSNSHGTGEKDSVIAEEVAKTLGVKHNVVSESNLYRKYFIDMVFQVNGMTYEHLWAMSLRNQLQNDSVSFDGLDGDVFFSGMRHMGLYNQNKGNYTDEELVKFFTGSKLVESNKLTEFFERKVSEQMAVRSTKLLQQIRLIEENKFKLTFLFLNSKNKNSNAIGSNNIIGNDRKSYFFFIDNALMDFGLKIPPKYKIKKYIYSKILQKAFPDIMQISSTNDNPGLYQFKKRILTIIKKILSIPVIKMLMQRTGVKTKKLSNINNHKKISAFPLNKEDEKYLLGIIKKLDFPSELNKDLLFEQMEKEILKGEKIDHILIPIANFLVWYNLFYLERSPEELKSI